MSWGVCCVPSHCNQSSGIISTMAFKTSLVSNALKLVLTASNCVALGSNTWSLIKLNGLKACACANPPTNGENTGKHRGQ